MRQLNSTLRNESKIKFESKTLGAYWEAGSTSFDFVNKSPVKAAEKLFSISQQGTSGRTQALNDDLRRLSQAQDLTVIFK